MMDIVAALIITIVCVVALLFWFAVSWIVAWMLYMGYRALIKHIKGVR